MNEKRPNDISAARVFLLPCGLLLVMLCSWTRGRLTYRRTEQDPRESIASQADVIPKRITSSEIDVAT
jgi:hypothetical protein